MSDTQLTITVVIPTYKRPESLRRCLESLTTQLLPEDEILIVIQSQDLQTLNLVKELGIKFEEVHSPGIVFAIISSIALVSTDLIAFIDDDVTLPPHWINQAKNNFHKNPSVGALGGTDLQRNVQLKEDVQVGKFTFFGKLIGNHHLASGSPRYVDFLKGCNMVLRTSVALKYSPIFGLLKGTGAQVGNDLILSLSSRLNGYKTVFDPNFFVFHHVEPRVESSQRHELNQIEKKELVHNILLIKLTFAKRFMRYLVLIYQLIVGDREVPGLIRSLILRKFQWKLWILDLKNLTSATCETLPLSSKYRQPLNNNRLGML